MRRVRPLALVVAVLVLVAGGLSLVMLDRARAGIERVELELAGSPATLYRPTGDAPVPLVVVAHGFGGSRQMMEAISLTLARAGLGAVAFDFLGHGRMADAMSPEVTVIEGTTQGLVAQTVAVATAARALPGIAGGDISLLGHSMATDVIVRAAERLDRVGGLVAISMYSDAVTADFPDRLLILSGARETRLREVALDKLHQIDPSAGEDETARGPDGLIRRVAVAPGVGHVGVLWSAAALAELRDWLGDAASPVARTGPWIALLLGAVLALAWPLSLTLPRREVPPPPTLSLRLFLAAAILPALPAALAAVAVGGAVFGLAAFGKLAAFFAVFGLVQLTILAAAGHRPARPDPPGAAALLGIGLGAFALLLDRYGAAFLPTGPRLGVMAILALGTLPFAVAASTLGFGAPLWRRLVVHLVPILALGAAMTAQPTALGISFTVLPVLILYLLVYGTMARWIAARRGPGASGPALGLILAWSIAASTPLFLAQVPG
ncbi:MAG: lysophospholipase [Paracoccaceae bacterium]